LNVSCDIQDYLDIKKKALAQHQTQMIKLNGSADWPVLGDIAQGDFLRCFFNGREYFHRYEVG
jgi:LmbE family N-acetylglucosaminyl deacetylase